MGKECTKNYILILMTYQVVLQLKYGISRYYIDNYTDVIMTAMVSQITGALIVYSTVCSGADQRKHQSFASLTFVRALRRWLVNSPQKGPVAQKMFPFDDASWYHLLRSMGIIDIMWHFSLTYFEIYQFQWINDLGGTTPALSKFGNG